MLLDCNLSQCLTHCALTAISVIVFTITLDIILYFAYAYFTVRRYYSSDLISQRNVELAKYGYDSSKAGKVGTKIFQWKEVFPPADNNANNIRLKTVTVNDKWIWGTTAENDIYMCKKPCNGTSEDTFWYKAPGKATEIAANNKMLWSVNDKSNVSWMSNLGHTGKWKTSPARLKHVSVGPTGLVWGTNADDKIYECKSGVASCSKGAAKNISSVQVAVGSSFVWSLDSEGIISQKSTSKNNWTEVPAPSQMTQIAVGKSDRLFALSQNSTLYELSNSKWAKVKDAPKLRFIATMTDATSEVYGISADNKLWLGEF